MAEGQVAIQTMILFLRLADDRTLTGCFFEILPNMASMLADARLVSGAAVGDGLSSTAAVLAVGPWPVAFFMLP